MYIHVRLKSAGRVHSDEWVLRGLMFSFTDSKIICTLMQCFTNWYTLVSDFRMLCSELAVIYWMLRTRCCQKKDRSRAYVIRQIFRYKISTIYQVWIKNLQYYILEHDTGILLDPCTFVFINILLHVCEDEKALPRLNTCMYTICVKITSHEQFISRTSMYKYFN